MTMLGEKVLLRIYLLSTDQHHTGPAYEHLVLRARRRHIAGATVLRGVQGFGARGMVPPSPWHVARPTPVIVEIVDAGEKIAAFVREEVLPVLAHGTVTLERAAVMLYRHRDGAAPQRPMELFNRVRDLSTLPDLFGSPAMTNSTSGTPAANSGTPAATSGAPAANSGTPAATSAAPAAIPATPIPAQSDGILLRIFAGDSDSHEGKPLHQMVVERARQMGLAGATVLKGSMGFGAHSILHTAKVLELSTDLPVVIELVDREENIRRFLPELDGLVQEGMITMESVRIVAHRAAKR